VLACRTIISFEREENNISIPHKRLTFEGAARTIISFEREENNISIPHISLAHDPVKIAQIYILNNNEINKV
jgi:hypothetical protein